MKIDLKRLSYDYEPVEYKDGVTLHLRPYPASMGGVDYAVKDGVLRMRGEEQCRVFKHCLGKWEGIVGADDAPAECTDQVKQAIFDHRFRDPDCGELVAFVLSWSQRAINTRETDLKN